MKQCNQKVHQKVYHRVLVYSVIAAITGSALVANQVFAQRGQYVNAPRVSETNANVNAPTTTVVSESNLDEEVNTVIDNEFPQQAAPTVAPVQQVQVVQPAQAQPTITLQKKTQKPSVQVNVNANPYAAQSQGTYQMPTQNQAPQQYSGQVAPVTAVAPQGFVQQQPMMTQQQAFQNLQQPTVVQRQPVTQIEASPLQDSKAELLRKSRQDAEVNTEAKIVEKLESSRLDDEKRRADTLFGEKFDRLSAPAQNQVQQAPAPAPVVQPVVFQEQVVTATPTKPAKAEVDSEAIRHEVKASLAELKSEEKPEKKKEDERKKYFGGMVGMGEYLDVGNVKGNYLLGFTLGQKTNDRFLVEGSFIYGSYNVAQRYGVGYCYGGYYGGGYCSTIFPAITEMKQYTGSVAAKYQLIGGMLRPVIGGLVNYHYRTFSDNYGRTANSDAQSHAVDLGVLTGADLELSDDTTVGLEFRYTTMNLYSRYSSGFAQGFSQTVYGSDTPIEKLNQLTIGITARAHF